MLCGRHGELSFEQPRHMQCFPLRTIVNLVPATGAIGYNDGIGHLPHRRQQADLCHLHGYVVMSCFIAEGSGHSTTRAFYQFRPRSRDESQNRAIISTVKQPATGTAIHQIVQKLHNSYQSSLRGDGRRLLQGSCKPAAAHARNPAARQMGSTHVVGDAPTEAISGTLDEQ